MDQISLYYPRIEPPTAWIRQALLISERVTSLVPPGFHPLAGDLLWLENEGYYSGTEVRWFGELEDYLDEVRGALEKFAASPAMRMGADVDPASVSTLRLGKLDHSVEQSLVDLNLATPRRGERSLIVHQRVAAVILAITARYVAHNYRDLESSMVLSTDTKEAVLFATEPLPGRPSAEQTVELILDGFIPAVPRHVSLADVIHFRERHRQELLAFRHHVDSLVQEVRTSEEPIHAIRAAKRDIEAGLTDLTHAAASARMPLVMGGMGIIGIACIHQLGAAEAVQWFFDGIGTAAGAYLISRQIRHVPNRLSPYSYILSTGKFGQL